MKTLFAKPVNCLPRDRAEQRSVHDFCRLEEDKHRWIECEKAQRDLGETAVRQWVREHWNNFLRAKWIEHLEGKIFWIELDSGDFGLLQSDIRERHELFDPILEKLKAGEENLNIIKWSNEVGLPYEPVHQILELLDINSRRLLHRFDEPQP